MSLRRTFYRAYSLLQKLIINYKDKAEELVQKMLEHQKYDPRIDLGKNKKVRAIKCSTIMVEEILLEHKNKVLETYDLSRDLFWVNVLEELSKLQPE